MLWCGYENCSRKWRNKRLDLTLVPVASMISRYSGRRYYLALVNND